MRKSKSKIAHRKRADHLFSEYIRKRDGRCMKCGTTQSLQCAHIIGRTKLRLRFDPRNAIALCVKCHLYWAHKEPLEFAEWYQAKYASDYKYLMKAKNEVEKPDYDEITESLNSLLKGLS